MRLQALQLDAVDDARRVLARSGCQSARLTRGLGQRRVFGGQHAGTGVVSDRLVGSAVHRLLVGDVAIALQHPLVGQPGDLLLRVLGGDQLANQSVAAGEAEVLGDHVGVDAVVARLAVLAADAKLAPQGVFALAIHLAQGSEVQLPGSGDRLVVLVGAARDEAARAVDRLGVDLGRHLGAHLTAGVVGLGLQALQRARAGVGQPFHVAHRAGRQSVQPFRRGGGEGALVFVPRLLGHVGRARLGQRLEVAHVLGVLDRLGAGQHPAHDVAHLVGQFDVQRGQRLIDV